MSDMAPDQELKGRSHISQEASGNKDPVGVMKELENNHMKCSSNGERKSSDMQVGTNKQTEGAFINLDLEVNMLEGNKSGNIKRVDVEEEKCVVDLTESSSSLDSDGTSSSFESDGTSFTAKDDLELYDDALSAFPFDGYGDLFQMRKKKLSPSWRKQVAPLKWRCKWVELQIKKFKLQAQKYESEIAEYNRREQLEISKLENVNSESLPFSAQSQKRAFMKRKNRRRTEDTEDISSYMSQHNLFSYFENKKSIADAGGTDGNLSNQGVGAEKPSNGTTENGVKEEFISREFEDRGNFLMQFFGMIGATHQRAREVKTRVYKVLRENSSRFSSNENLSLPMSRNNSLMSSAENLVSPFNNEDEIVAVASSISNEIVCANSDTEMVDVAMPESAALKLGEVNHISENNKSVNPPAIGGSSKNPTSTILMYNRRAKMNQKNKSKEVNIVSSQKPQGSTEDHQGSSSNAASYKVSKNSTPKMISLSKMMANTTGSTSFKRKRAMRKAGSGKWN